MKSMNRLTERMLNGWTGGCGVDLDGQEDEWIVEG